MLASGRFWVGVIVGVALVWAYKKYGGMHGSQGQ